jgi:3-hydroxybutyryl-CoA dehydrogenase
MDTVLNLVGVVGAGVMGVGVAQALAQAGCETLVVDVSQDALDRAAVELRNGLRLSRMLARPMSSDPEAAFARVRFTTDLETLAPADFVIENVTERWDVKADVWQRLAGICAPGCVIAANTSVISITRLAALTRSPAQVVGIHFMNPVPLKPMVEVIRGYHTSDTTLATTGALLARMGKRFVVVKDMPGFVSNRVLMLTVNEAIWLVQDQVAGAREVDEIFRGCFAHPSGPLETADLIGLDTILYSLQGLYESYRDSKFRPCPLLQTMVDAGLHGRKTGRGFYEYGD